MSCTASGFLSDDEDPDIRDLGQPLPWYVAQLFKPGEAEAFGFTFDEAPETDLVPLLPGV